MTKYIVKQKAISALINEANTHSNPVKRAYTRAAALIEQITAEDVQPVKRGKWKHIAGMNSKCSVCSHYFPVTEFDSRPFDINFCPQCGARMDLGDEKT